MDHPPFVVFSLPRSRTFWLSRFLSYGGWECGHDELRHCRGMDDVRSWLAQPATGTVETAAAPFWRLLPTFRPDARVVVLRRPVAEVVESLARLGFDRTAMVRIMRRLDAKLDQIEARMPGVLSVQASALDDEETCRRVFEHCLPFPYDPAWHAAMAPLNLQTNMAATVRYAAAHAGQIEKLRSVAAHQCLANLQRPSPAPGGGIVIREEPLDAYIDDARDLFEDHAAAIGEPSEYWRQLNFEMMRRLDNAGALQTMIARCNGRVFGYMLTVIAPSMDDVRVLAAQHTTFFASEQFPGLGMKLTRAANAALRAKGVGEIIHRAGVRGDGPRLGTLYRRLGAEDYGHLYVLRS